MGVLLASLVKHHTEECFVCLEILQVVLLIFVETMRFIRVAEITTGKGWFPPWIETDSSVIVQKEKTRSLVVPWQLKVRWQRCMAIISSKPYHISYIYREGNNVETIVGLLMYDLNSI